MPAACASVELTDEFCPRGHPKRRRGYDGRTECLTCRNAWRRAKRALERDGRCKHVTGFRSGEFEGLLNTRDHMVCLTCLVVEANKVAAARKA